MNSISNIRSSSSAPIAAQSVVYNNTTSGLQATNVQDAIDEVAQGGGGSATPIATATGDGTKTREQLLNELFAQFSNIGTSSYIVRNDGTTERKYPFIQKSANTAYFAYTYIENSKINCNNIGVKSSGSVFEYFDGTYSDGSSVTEGVGTTYKLYK